MLSRGRLLLAAVLATVVGLGVATVVLSGFGLPGDGPEAEAPPEPATTPWEEYDASALAPARAPFCGNLEPESIIELLDGEPRRIREYGNGDPLPENIEEVSHEYGCIVVGAGRDRLRAWIFVPPVDPKQARELVASASEQEGCSRVQGKAFGKPGATTVCRSGRVTKAVLQGRFDDTWVSCSAEGRAPQAAVRERAGRWCGAVLEAATPEG